MINVMNLAVQNAQDAIPLHNLFFYLKELYSNSKPVLDFTEDKNTHWKLETLKKIFEVTEKRKDIDYKLNLNQKENFSDFFLSIKRTIIPLEPAIPLDLKEWLTIQKTNSTPILKREDTIEIKERFEDSQQRLADFQLFIKTDLSDIPKSLINWVGVKEEEILRKSDISRNITFESDVNRVQLFSDFEKIFNEYYKKYSLPLSLNKVYDAFHRLNYELKSKDELNLFLSFGLISGNIGGKKYQNHLFHVPLRMTLTQQKIKLEFDYLSSNIISEQHFTSLLDQHFINESSNVVNERKSVVSKKINDFNSGVNVFSFENSLIRKDYYDLGLEIMSIFSNSQMSFFDGETLDYRFHELNEKYISFSFSPIIQTKVNNNFQSVANDADKIGNEIRDLVKGGKQGLIPNYFKSLFDVKSTSEQLPTKTSTSENESEHVKTQDYLFPLPFNDEQLEIARRIDAQDAVVVKGPPGTGKSHTIANLIAHYVAQGKSILVVAQKSKSLSVLQDKLPKEIRTLTVSLSDEEKGTKALRNSVEGIINNLSRVYSQERLNELQQNLSDINDKKAQILERIYEVISKNNQKFEIYNPDIQSIQSNNGKDWAMYLSEQRNDTTIRILKDNILHTQKTNSLVDFLMEFYNLGKSINTKDFELVHFNFINEQAFVDARELRKTKIAIQQLNSKIEVSLYKGSQPKSFDQNLVEKIKRFEVEYEIYQQSTFFKSAFQSKKLNLEQLKKLLKQHEKAIQQIDISKEILINYSLDLSALGAIDPDILQRQINGLIVKFGAAQVLSWLQKTTLDKNSKRFFGCKVNGIEVENIEQLKVIEIEILKRTSLKQLTITFNNFLKAHGYDARTDIEELLKEFRFILFFDEIVQDLNKELQKRHLSNLNIAKSNIQDDITFLKNGILFSEIHQLNDFLVYAEAKLRIYDRPHPLINDISQAIMNLENSNYEYLVTKYKEHKSNKKKVEIFEGLFKQLSAEIPLTLKSLNEDFRAGKSPVIDKEMLLRDIFILKIKDFLEFITTETQKTDALLKQLQLTKYNIEQHTERLIAYKAWYIKAKNTNEKEKIALSAWLNDLVNFGKGTGKNATKNLKSAIEKMKMAKKAVPVWIMRRDKAITLFSDATPQQFDLLIIDEASQCDLSALNLIFKCKKTLIVGDSNQTAVGKRITTIEKYNELLEKYFPSHPYQTAFDPTNSIYTLSSVIYPNIITLKEHFRCLPEIIGFSNKHVYNNEMIPLKTAIELPFGKPIESHYVVDNFDDIVKKNVVSKVVAEIENYIEQYENGTIKILPTIGIIALDSSNKNHIKELIRQVSSNESIRKYEDTIQLLIGTAREFQGDERDIMFLTIATSHRIDEKSHIMKPPRAVTSEEFMRIYNVAASRAREKSVLIHSIHPEAIPLMRTDCYRKKIIDYYNSYNKTTELQQKTLDDLLRQVDPNSGEFEKTVCISLFNNGYGNYLFPQFNIGNYNVDFAIIKNNQKIAIECDGQKYHSSNAQIQNDIKRQLILERAGWQFFRIQSVDWFTHKEVVAQKMVNWLNDCLTK